MLRLLEFGFDEEAKGTQWAREALVTTSSGRLRFGLDLVSTLAIVAACTVIVWTRYGPPTAALRTLPAPENPVSLEGTVIRGAPDAPVTVLMYTDYQCPYCARFEQTTLQTIDRDYIQTGRVRLAVRHLPLETIHPAAFGLAVAATCAADQGRFWELHASLFENQKRLDTNQVADLARAVGLDMDAFAACAEGTAAVSRVRADLESAAALGLTGTPAVLIGRIDSGGMLRVDVVVPGAWSAENLARIIDGAMGTRQRVVWVGATVGAVAFLGCLF